jgi:CheY-like chemotaxis protein
LTPKSKPKKTRILVIDDDQPTLAALRGLLQDEGYAVVCAADAPTALVLAEREPPDLILLDLAMPIMDGRGFAAQYHSSPGPHAPIVLVSAQQQLLDDVEHIEAAGFIRKPFRFDEVLDVVHRFTASRAAAARASGAASPRRKPAREEVERQQRVRYLKRLQMEVTDLRRQLSEVNAQTRELLAIQEMRPLTADEGQRTRTLNRESTRLSYELQRLFNEFERVRSGSDGNRPS